MAGISPHLKLHRFSVTLDGKTYTVMTPRPTLKSRFANNLFHGTRHVLTDAAGAQFLSKIFWWLSYQRTPNSIVAITGDHLSPSPFEQTHHHQSPSSTPIAHTSAARPPTSYATHFDDPHNPKARYGCRRRPSTNTSLAATNNT